MTESALTAYPKGDKQHIHISLYQRSVTTLDAATAAHECSRAEFIEALITDYSKGLMPGVDMLLSSRKELKK